MTATALAPPTGLRNVDEAVARYGPHGERWLAAMWQGYPLADAVVDELGGRALGPVKRAITEGVTDATPDSVRALFAQLEDEPAWVDHDRLDRAAAHLVRQPEIGIALGAASLVAGANNAIAGKPLRFTGRYASEAAVRSIEVGAWFKDVTTPGGLRRDGAGFEKTVRVRMIHALVRGHLKDHEEWETEAWGVPIPQPYMAFTLAEFGSVALNAVRKLGVRYPRDERADIFHLWRYVGHLIGMDPALNPISEGDHHRIEELYALTSPGPDDEDRRFVRALFDDYLAIELARAIPLVTDRGASRYLDGLARTFVGEAQADALALRDTRLKHVPRVLGPVALALYTLFDLIPGMRARRTARAFQRRDDELARLRTTYGVQHDLVDTAPASTVGHPAQN
jgi:hypothetical protein